LAALAGFDGLGLGGTTAAMIGAAVPLSVLAICVSISEIALMSSSFFSVSVRRRRMEWLVMCVMSILEAKTS